MAITLDVRDDGSGTATRGAGGASSAARAARPGSGPEPGTAAGAATPGRVRRADAAAAHRGRLSRGEATFLLTQLSLVLETGTPLATGLRQIASQGDARLGAVAESLLAELETGNTFTRALSHHPGLFSPGEVSMIQVGETGGFMGEMMNRVVALRERSEKLRAVVRSAMAYPLILMAVATIVIAFMLGFVFPRFEHVFDDMETALPLSTRILLGSSTFLRHYGGWVLGAAAIAIALGARWLRTPRGRRSAENTALALPGVGPLLREIALTHLFLNLGSLLQARVPLLSALDTTRSALRLGAFRDLVDEIAAGAERGEGVSAGLARSPLVPALARSIIATGEETGRVDQVFLRLSAHYDEQVEKRVKALTTLLEPVLLVGMGGIVSFVVISLILPIFRMSRGVH